MKKSLYLASMLILMFVIFTSLATAATFVVNTTADTQDTSAGNGVCADSSGNCSLRAAITEANALAGADTITLPAGTYTITLTGAENANAGGDFDLNSEITINGAGSATTIVQAAATRNTATERVFHLRSSNTMNLNDLTVRYGRYTTAAGTFGAGIRVDTAAVVATLTNVVVTENDDGTSGGGIAVSGTTAGASLTLNNCTVSNNTAGGTGAASSTGAGIMGNAAAATININNSMITGNTVSNTSTTVSVSGGGISSIGTLNITDSMITNNTAASSGNNTFSGGVHVTAGTATITGSTISGNASTVTAGTGSGFAGGIYNQQATVNVINSTVSGNSASSFHGGIRALGQTVLTTTNITNSTISGNTAPGEGGGVINFSVGAANVIVNITGSTISGNMSSGGTSVGGGIENFSNSTGLATINLTNSTVSGNSAANGAGTWNTGANSSINLNFSTVASNTATTNGGGLFQDVTGTTNLKNSIVADNSAATGPDIFGTITSQDYNHVENTSGGTFFVESEKNEGRYISTTFLLLPNDVTGIDPQLGVLQNNGGPTFTKLPSGTSPVVDTIPNGTNDCGTIITSDQRNITRPQSTGCDKGAAELVPTAANAFISGKVVTTGGQGMSNVIVTLSGGNLPAPLYFRTNSFGNFRFDDLEVGQTYILQVSSRKTIFQNPTQLITLAEDASNIVFTANE